MCSGEATSKEKQTNDIYDNMYLCSQPYKLNK